MNLEVNASGDKNKVFKINANDFLSMFSSIHGDKVKDGLVYKVQIGAYQFPDAFNYKHFAGMPKLIREIGKDHITRFSMGNYASYNEAHVLLKSLLANGLMDAFVVAIYKGERKTLSRLIEEKILE